LSISVEEPDCGAVCTPPLRLYAGFHLKCRSEPVHRLVFGRLLGCAPSAELHLSVTAGLLLSPNAELHRYVNLYAKRQAAPISPRVARCTCTPSCRSSSGPRLLQRAGPATGRCQYATLKVHVELRLYVGLSILSMLRYVNLYAKCRAAPISPCFPLHLYAKCRAAPISPCCAGCTCTPMGHHMRQAARIAPVRRGPGAASQHGCTRVV
jgi:hypothetical protein